MWRSPAGELRIVYEDLLTSEPGWGTPPTGVATRAMSVPADDVAALAAWDRLAPTGATYEAVLASLPADPAVRRPLARALLAGGRFACEATDELSSCGEDRLVWLDLAPGAGIDDPCLRRRLALWALPEAADADVAQLGDVLEAMVRLPPPEDELPAAALARVPADADELRLRLIAAAVEVDRIDLAEQEAAKLVGDGAIVRAATVLHLDAAAARLDPARHRAERVAALADTALGSDVRSTLLGELAHDPGGDVAAALAAVAEQPDCALAMEAAEALAARGDPSHLPRKPTGAHVEDYARELCELAFARDATYQAARWRELLARRVTVGERVESDWDPTEASSERVPRGDVDLPYELQRAEWECAGLTCTWTEDYQRYSVDFEVAGAGLRIVGLLDQQWHGCLC